MIFHAFTPRNNIEGINNGRFGGTYQLHFQGRSDLLMNIRLP